MTKTATSLHSVNYPNQQPAEIAADQQENNDEMFYNSIKLQLNQLIKDPSDDVINKILAHSKKK